jgi:hypothetical protein
MYKYRFAYPLPDEEEVLKILKTNNLLEKMIDETWVSSGIFR